MKKVDNFSELISCNKVDVLKPEGKLILHLMENGSSTIKQAMYVSKISYRAFYMMIERLKERYIIKINESVNDKRVKIISLSDSIFN